MTRELPGTLKVITVWSLVGLVLFLGIQWALYARQATRFQIDGEVLEIRRGVDGHYHWPGHINQQPVAFLIDTGATGSALPTALARRLELVSEGSVSTHTAGGTVRGERVRAEVRLRGGVVVEHLAMTALPGLGGVDDPPLLGMDVLGKLRWSQHDGVLRIDLRRQP